MKCKDLVEVTLWGDSCVALKEQSDLSRSDIQKVEKAYGSTQRLLLPCR